MANSINMVQGFFLSGFYGYFSLWRMSSCLLRLIFAMSLEWALLTLTDRYKTTFGLASSLSRLDHGARKTLAFACTKRNGWPTEALSEVPRKKAIPKLNILPGQQTALLELCDGKKLGRWRTRNKLSWAIFSHLNRHLLSISGCDAVSSDTQISGMYCW